MKAGFANNASFSKTRAKWDNSGMTLRMLCKYSKILALRIWRVKSDVNDYEKLGGKVRIFARW